MVQESKQRRKKSKGVRLGTEKAVPNVKSDLLPRDSNVTFNFIYKDWLKTVKIGNFTNKLQDVDEFAEKMYNIMNTLIPYIIENWDWMEDVVGLRQHHCHPVAKDKLPLVKHIITETYSGTLDALINIDDDNLWQLGLHGSIRLIVYYMKSDKTFYPLFVDYHHLIHPEDDSKLSRVKHNDYKTKSWCPVAHFS